MKFGLTISDYYKEYIEEIAKLNGISPTTMVGYIVENFLSFNKKNGRFPIVQKSVTMVYATKKAKESNEETTEVVENTPTIKELASELNKDKLLKDLEKSQFKDMTLVDDELPF